MWLCWSYPFHKDIVLKVEFGMKEKQKWKKKRLFTWRDPRWNIPCDVIKFFEGSVKLWKVSSDVL